MSIRWRCQECRHGRNLEAASLAVVFGPLGADGHIERYDSIEDTDLFVSSIQCTRHLDFTLQRFVSGRWRRFSPCPACRGRGEKRSVYGEATTCRECRGEGGEWNG